MTKGISIYLGMDNTLEENLEYISKAKKYGFTDIFTSFHIPEANYEKVISEFKEITKLANRLGMKIVADISPRAFNYLGASMDDLKAIANLGVYGIRIDFGYSPKQIANFTRNSYDLKVEINASTVTKKFLDEFEKFNPDFTNFMACHNYYPRMNTGISEKKLVEKNNMLKKYNIPISAFIPSLVNKRGPIFEGLPTLEMHRFLDPRIAAKHLLVLGVDNILFGDSIPSDEEIEKVGLINEDYIEFDIELYECSDIEKKIVFNAHKNRPDSAEDVIRSTESRNYLKEDDIIEQFNNIERRRGDITIDNSKYLRYKGELQICKKDLPKDERVNVVGKVVDDELFLLEYVNDETKFKFCLKNKVE